MSARIAERVKLLEKIGVLLMTVRTRLECYREPLNELIGALCKMQGLSRLRFLENCRDLCETGVPFCDAWERSIRADGAVALLNSQDSDLLVSIGAALGTTGLESQLDGLTVYGELLKEATERARREAGKYCAVYSCLGISAGIALGIIII